VDPGRGISHVLGGGGGGGGAAKRRKKEMVISGDKKERENKLEVGKLRLLLSSS